MVATATEDEKMALWDGRTGEPLPNPFSESQADYKLAAVYSLPPAFSPSGALAAAAVTEPLEDSEEGYRGLHLRIWLVRTGATVKTFGWRVGTRLREFLRPCSLVQMARN